MGEGRQTSHRRGLGFEGQVALGAVLSSLMQRKPRRPEIGRYQIRERLGEGAHGCVYAATDPELSRDVAVKVVTTKRKRRRDPHRVHGRMIREARALATLRHPNVVQIFDIGETEGDSPSLYVVMELVRGQTLSTWLQSPQPWPDVLARFVEAGRGLAAAHAAGIVHRDFKPSNVMVCDDGVKVLDFGLARIDEDPTEDDTTDVHEVLDGDTGVQPDVLTRTGAVMGTPKYMALEQHEGGEVTARSDQYAWCVAVWEALYGAPPFPARSARGLEAAKRRGPPTRPPRPDVPAAIFRVLRRGLLPRPRARHADMATLLRRIEAAARPRRRWPLAVAAVTVVGALAGGLAWTSDAAVECPQPVVDAELWSDARQQRIQRKMRASDPRDPDLLWRRLEGRVRRQLDDWHEVRAQLCATDAPPGLGDAVVEVRQRCLRRGLRRFEDTLAALGDEAQFGAGVRQLWAQRSPLRCLQMTQSERSTRTAAEDAMLDAFDAELTALTMLPSQQIDDAVRRRVAKILEIAIDLDDAATAARALTHQAEQQVTSGDTETAARTIEEAVWRAQAAGNDLLAAELVPAAVRVWLETSVPREVARAKIDRAWAMLHAAGDPPSPTADLEWLEGYFFMQHGDLDRGAEHLSRVLELSRDDDEVGAYTVAQAHLGLAQVARARGDLDGTLTHVDEAIRRAPPVEVAGPDTVGIAHSLRAGVARIRGDHETAAREILAAIRLQGLRWGPSTPMMAGLLGEYASALVSLGAPDEGIQLFDDTLAALRDSGHGESLTYWHLLGNATLAELRTDRPAAAWARIEAAETALADMVERDPRRGIQLARLQAAALVGMERFDDAVARLASIPGDDETLVRMRAEAALGQGRLPQAREHADAVLARPMGPEAAGRSDRGRTHWVRSRIAQAEGDEAAAHEHAARAERLLAQGTVHERRLAATIAASQVASAH